MILEEKKVVCNGCKKTLRIPNKKLEAARQVICPVCKTSLFVNFYEEDQDSQKETDTVYTPFTGNNPYIEYNGKKYFLEKNVSIIGRKASSSTADIQLDTDDMYMGRHHAIITKETNGYGSTSCFLKAKDAKNGLSVNDIELSSDDRVNLLDGAHIRMGNTVIAFRKN